MRLQKLLIRESEDWCQLGQVLVLELNNGRPDGDAVGYMPLVIRWHAAS